MDKDFIRLIHEYAYEHLNDGVSYPDTVQYLRDNGVDVDDVKVKHSVQRTFSQVFVDSNRASIGFDTNFSGKDFYMLTDAYYRYLEYLELVESRKNAESAKKQSTIAICLTLLALLASIIIGILQFQQPKY